MIESRWIPDDCADALPGQEIRLEGWTFMTGEEDWEPCGAKRKMMGTVCMARPGHEHPHVNCNIEHELWTGMPRLRITSVGRRTGVTVYD